MRTLLAILILNLSLSLSVCFAEEKIIIPQDENITDSYKLKIPVQVDSVPEAALYVFILQEKLKLEHNAQGVLFNAGNLAEEDWNAYKEVYEQKRDLIYKATEDLKNLLRKSTKYNPSIQLSDIAVPK